MTDMAHQRFRTFNTRDTYPEQKLDNDLCQAVVARGNIVFLRGQVGQDLETREIGRHRRCRRPDRAGDGATSTQLLEEAGARLEHICKIIVYLTDLRYREPVYRVDRQLAEGRLPGLDRARRQRRWRGRNGWSRST